MKLSFRPLQASCVRFLTTTAKLVAISCVTIATPSFCQVVTTTSLAVTSNGSPVTNVAYASSVTLTASVRAGESPVYPGAVNFCDATAKYCTDIHILGSAQLTSAGIAVFRFIPSAGSHQYKAVFVETNTYVTSNSAISSLSTGSPIPTTTTLAISSRGSEVDSLDAEISSQGNLSASPTGTLTFLDAKNGNKVLGSKTLDPGSLHTVVTDSATTMTDNSPSDVAIGDFDEDEIPDLLFVVPKSKEIAVFPGKGDGTFRAAINSDVGVSPIFLTVADFNSDGILDVATANSTGGAITVFLGNGDGTFGESSSLGSQLGAVGQVVQGDFNHDGIPDLAVLCTPIGETFKEIVIELGNGDGTFLASGSIVRRDRCAPFSARATAACARHGPRRFLRDRGTVEGRWRHAKQHASHYGDAQRKSQHRPRRHSVDRR